MYSNLVGKPLLMCLLLPVIACGHAPQPTSSAPAPEPQRPKLVVGIVVDQMRHDYIARFWNHYGEGGFKRLMGEGSSYEQCHYNYVPTETAPGHASIFTGTTPALHGIIMNEWIDQTTIANGAKVKAHSSVEDTLHPLVGVKAVPDKPRGASPLRLQATTLVDPLKAATQGKAICIGISLKDRSAILPVGKQADAAYWFDDATGNMVSSSYYPAMKGGLPAWVDSLNALRQPLRLIQAPEGWELVDPASTYTAPDGPEDGRYEGTFKGEKAPVFPHKLRVDTANCCEEFKSTPWGNTFLKDFAEQAILHHGLGADTVPDLLSLSFSSTDIIAHQYGPQSREVEDTYRRLDRDLAEFLSFLDARIGKENVLVFLTADHGGAANPDYARAHGESGGWLEYGQMHRHLRKALGDKPGRDSLVSAVKGHNVYLNRRLAKERRLNLDSLSQVVVASLTGFPGIEKAYTAAELAKLQPANEGERLLKNGFYPDCNGDVLFLAQYGYMQPPSKDPGCYKKGTSHGTHYAYDTHVPLLFWGSTVPHQTSSALVEIPDIAVTVCKLLAINPTDKASGKVVPGL